jgi:hypothetical protein
MPAQIVQSGQLNLAALIVPGVYIVIVPPQLLINGVPTNVVGYVGSASWGPDNQPAVASSYPSYVGQFGNMVPRPYDMGTHVWVAYQYPNSQVVAQCVRVTDGTDTAASGAIQTSCATATSKWTGSGGNNQTVQIVTPGTAANSIKAILTTPNANLVEVFDNILQGVSSLAVTAGTGGFTAVPGLTLTAAPAGGVNASAGASLTVIGTPTVPGSGGGTGANVGDFVTFANGVVLKVATVSSGAVATWAAVSTSGCSGGSLTGAGTTAPTTLTQVSTTGSGAGAQATVSWGLGPAVNLVPGAGYTAAPTATLSATAGGASYAAAIDYWTNLVSAVNNGQGPQRGPSAAFVFTLGSATTTPTNSTYALSGGTDGANVAPSNLVGSNALPYTGMYALQGKGCSIGVLCDVTASSTWAVQVAFGLANGLYMMGTTASGDTLANAPTELSTAGVDTYGMKMMFGDWVQINDTINNQLRYVSPQAFAAQIFGNQAPNQSSLNSQVYGVVGTQKSATGQSYQPGDIQTLVTSRMDVIASPSPGGSYFACQTGRNCASNAAVNGDNYTRMVNFLAVTFANALGIYVGKPGTPGEARSAKSALDSFMTQVQYTAGLIGDPGNPGAPPSWSSSVAPTQPNGVQLATMSVQLQAITMEFVLNLQAGQTVTVNVSPQPST